MTMKQCINKNGWEVNTDTSQPYRSMDVDVTFYNNGNELTELFSEFCMENNIPKNTVVNIIVVRVYEKAA